MIYSAPVAILLVIAVLKLVSVTIAGNAAVSSFADGDAAALGEHAAALGTLNIIEPEKAAFAEGAHAVLEDRLDDAARSFGIALARSDSESACPARVNLEIVQETLGDRAVAADDRRSALDRYVAARGVAEQAAPGCFGGNTDPDSQRRVIRADTLARLDAKIDTARNVAPSPPAVSPPSAESPPAPGAGVPGAADTPRWLNPAGGDPLDRLRQLLRDGAKISAR